MKYLTYLMVLALFAVGQTAYGACTCAAGCSSTTAISPGFAGGGAGEFCWTATNLGTYVQSWGCDVLNITGVDYTNLYVSTGNLLRDSTGTYYIYYKSSNANGHFEASGSSIVSCCSSCTHVWCSCEQYGTITLNGYSLNNDLWGSSPGPQCIWADSQSSWGVHSDQPNTSGVKSYPHVGWPVNKTVSAMGSCTSTFNVTVPSSGAYETAYDIWVPSEVMIWMNKYGAVGPIASGWDDQGNPIPSASNVTVGGHTWDVYHGGSNVVSFVRQGNVNSGTVDIKAILDWIVNQGWISGGGTVSDIQFGFEITSAAGGLDFTCNSYSVGGGGTTTTTAASTTTTAASTTTTASTTSTAATTTTTAATTTTTAATTSTTSATTSTTTTSATTTTTAATTTTTAATTTTTAAAGCTCDSGCDGTAITPNFTKDGAGQFCWQATSGTYINSWNTNKVEVNNTVYTNTYVLTSSFPAKINGVWYIYYDSSVAWGHFELKN